MTMTDPIADMLTRIRNAAKAKFKTVDIPGSRLKIELARVLKEQGYIRNYKFIEDGKQGILRLTLKYLPEYGSVIQHLERVSRPSRRVYVKSKEIRPVYNGTGIAVLSTSRGILSDGEARNRNVGGEILCKIW